MYIIAFKYYRYMGITGRSRRRPYEDYYKKKKFTTIILYAHSTIIGR